MPKTCTCGETRNLTYRASHYLNPFTVVWIWYCGTCNRVWIEEKHP